MKAKVKKPVKSAATVEKVNKSNAGKEKKHRKKSRESQEFLSMLEASKGQPDEVEAGDDDLDLQDEPEEDCDQPSVPKKKANKKGKKVHVDDEEAGEQDEDGNYNPFISSIAALEGAPRFLHVNDETSVANEAMSSILGKEAVTMEDMIKELATSEKDKRDLMATVTSNATKKGRKASKKEAEKFKLDKPVTGPAGERVARAAIYSRVKEDVSQWDAVVHSRRAAETVSFPQRNDAMRLPTAKEAASAFKPQTPLEKEVAALLQKSRAAVVQPGKELSEREENALANLSLHEAIEKRKELSRLRALQSYQEAKLKRQNKIKSKRYRKIQRKQKEKEKLQELEELQKTNPELAQEKMEEMDKIRIAERASLKHRNSSKYLQMQARRARQGNDKESHKNLMDQLERHRSLMAKNYDDTEDQKDEVEDQISEDEEAMAEALDNNVLNEMVANNEKTLEERKARKAALAAERIKDKLSMTQNIDDLFHVADSIMQKKVADRIAILSGKKRPEEEVNDVGEEEEEEEEEFKAMSLDVKKQNGQISSQKDNAAKPTGKKTLDPDAFVVTKDLANGDLVMQQSDDDGEEDDEGQEDGPSGGKRARMSDQEAAIAEAFADDDVVVDFNAEKKKQLEKEKPKDIDLTLPGWGDWGGNGLTVSKRKRKRFTIKAKPAPPRKDANKGALILNEHKDERVKKHMVKSVPFPYTSVADFEASIRAPVGETFVPRTAFKKMVKPRIEVKAGSLIEPMSREELVKRKIAES